MTLLLYHGGVPSVIPPPEAGEGVPVLHIRELVTTTLVVMEPPAVRLHIRRLDS